MKINDDNIIHIIVVTGTVLVGVLALLGSILVSLRFAGSVVAGGIIALANFFWLATTLKRVLLLPSAAAGRFAYVRYLIRLAVTGVALYVVVVPLRIDLAGLLLGLSVLVVSITGLAIYKMTLNGG